MYWKTFIEEKFQRKFEECTIKKFEIGFIIVENDGEYLCVKYNPLNQHVLGSSLGKDLHGALHSL